MESLKNTRWFNITVFFIEGSESMQCAYDLNACILSAINFILEAATLTGIQINCISLFPFIFVTLQLISF